MQNNDQNIPIPSPLPQQPQKWYQHKGLWAILILTIIAAGVGTLYYIKQPKPDLSPIIVNHKEKSQVTFEPLKFNTTPEDFKDWNTFVYYDKYNFEFKFPAWDFGPSSHGSGGNSKLTLDSVGFNNFYINFGKNPDHLSLKDWFEKFIDDNGGLLNNQLYEFRSFNGLEAMFPLNKSVPQKLAMRGGLGHESLVMSPSKDFVVLVDLNEGQSSDIDSKGFVGFEGHDKLVKLIIASFKFNSTLVNTSDWNTYDSENGFQFKYPKDWSLKTVNSAQKNEEIYLFAPNDDEASDKITINSVDVIPAYRDVTVKERVKKIARNNLWDIYITKENQGLQTEFYDAYFIYNTAIHIGSRNVPESTKVIDGILSTFRITK